MPDSVLWDTVCGLLPADPQQALDVLDLGGGTGGLAVPLAALGHRVTVVDSSPDALAALDRRAGESGVAGSLVALQGDADDLQVEAGSVRPGAVPRVARTRRRPGPSAWPGSRGPYVRAAGSAWSSPSAVPPWWARRWPVTWPGPRPCSTTPTAAGASPTRSPAGSTGPRSAAWSRSAGFTIDDVHGLRVLGDLVPGQLLESDPAARARLLALDARLAGQPDYAGLAGSLHLLAHRPVDTVE